MSGKTLPQKVTVTNASDCAGHGSDGFFRGILLLLILACLVIGLYSIEVELRVQNEILGVVHDINVKEIRSRLGNE